MTPKQAERLIKKIAVIKRVLAAEKRKFGGYDDSRGLRYLPTRYYLQLGDYRGGWPTPVGSPKPFPTIWAFRTSGLNGPCCSLKRVSLPTQKRKRGRPSVPKSSEIKQEFTHVATPEENSYIDRVAGASVSQHLRA